MFVPPTRRLIPALLAVIVSAALIAVPGCGGETTPDAPAEPTATPSIEPSTTPTLPDEDGSAETTAAPASPQYVNVYLARGETLGVSRRQIPATKAVATAAMRELLLGPTGTEDENGLHTEIPLSAKLHSVSISKGVATVDLSPEAEDGGGSLSVRMRLAQIVFTLTQFRTVDSVRFLVDGKAVTTFSSEGIVVDRPQTRADYGDVLPAVLVESPVPEENVTSPLRITGMGNTFEGTFIIQLKDPTGKVIHEAPETAGAMGEWKSFVLTVPFDTEHTGIGTLTVYTLSAKDGTREDIVAIPIKMTR